MSTITATRSTTYTALDVENVVRRVKADLIMIADSTGAWTAAKAADYAHDVEQLAKKGYLSRVDVTLFNGPTEIKAVQFDIDTDAGSWTSARPGGVLWPRVTNPYLRIVLFYTSAYDEDARRTMRDRLKIGWSPTDADTSHSSLNGSGGRDYASNAFGMKRKDWTN